MVSQWYRARQVRVSSWPSLKRPLSERFSRGLTLLSSLISMPQRGVSRVAVDLIAIVAAVAVASVLPGQVSSFNGELLDLLASPLGRLMCGSVVVSSLLQYVVAMDSQYSPSPWLRATQVAGVAVLLVVLGLVWLGDVYYSRQLIATAFSIHFVVLVIADLTSRDVMSARRSRI